MTQIKTFCELVQLDIELLKKIQRQRDTLLSLKNSLMELSRSPAGDGIEYLSPELCDMCVKVELKISSVVANIESEYKQILEREL